MTQTNQSSLESNLRTQTSTMSNCDDPDLLEILSLCDGTADDYDINDDDYLSDDRKLDKSIDTTSSSYTKSSSAERDDDSDVVILRNQHNNRAPSAFSLPQESIRSQTALYPIHYSDKSLNSSHTAKSECGGSSSSSSAGSSTVTANNRSASSLPPRRPFVLHLTNESFHNILELPSPSSASLHSAHGNILQELTTKSNSAPILLKKELKRDDFVGQTTVGSIFMHLLSFPRNFCFVWKNIFRNAFSLLSFVNPWDLLSLCVFI